MGFDAAAVFGVGLGKGWEGGFLGCSSIFLEGRGRILLRRGFLGGTLRSYLGGSLESRRGEWALLGFEGVLVGVIWAWEGYNGLQTKGTTKQGSCGGGVQ